MAGTAGRYGYVTLGNDDPMEGPTQITEAGGQWDTLLNETVPTVGDLPASGTRPTGHHVWVTAENCDYVWTGSEWVAQTHGPFGYARRTTTVVTSGNNAYANLSASAAWAIANSEASDGVTYDAGFTVPLAGLYLLEWSIITVASVEGIAGIAINASGTPGGDTLHAAGPIVSVGATLGNGAAHVRLSAGDKLTLWGYGKGGVYSISNSPAAQTHWGFRRVAA